MTRTYFVEQDARVIRPDELARLLQGHNAQTLADELGLVHSTVWRALRKYGLRYVGHWAEEPTDDFMWKSR